MRKKKQEAKEAKEWPSQDSANDVKLIEEKAADS
jgi:hypothetical protein